MKKILLLLTTVYIAISTQASVHIVTNINDNGTGSLRHTINLASPNDTLRFNHSIASTSSATILLDSTLTINKPLTIIGKRNGVNEIMISGEFLYRVFDINCTGNFMIDSLAIIKGKETTLATGGGINFSGDTLKLNFVRFFNNEGRIGGAINATNLIITNGNFLDNTGVIRGGAINSSQSCSIENTYFINNKAGHLGREGIVLYSLGKLKLKTCFFRNSTTTSSYPLSTVFHTGVNTINNHTEIENTEFLNNPCRALKIYNSDVFVDSCVFRTNRGGMYVSNASSSANDIVEIKNSDFFNNTENSGIEIEGQEKLFINNNLIKFNGTFMNYTLGGGLNISGVDSVLMFNSQIENNFSSNGGGGALITGRVEFIKVQNSRFQGNVSDEKAVSAYQYEGGSGMYISTNTSTDLFFNHCFFNGNYSNPNGARTSYKGALVVEIAEDSISSNVNIDNCTFNKNRSFFSSAIWLGIVGSSSSVKAHSKLTINHSTFSDNVASKGYLISSYGGSWGDNKSEIEISNSTLFGNHSNEKLIYSGTHSAHQGTEKITIVSSIIADKDSNNFETDTLLSKGYNIFSDSLLTNSHVTDRFNIDSTILLLDTLKNNGGLTPTLLPKTGSIVINNGNPSDRSDAQNGPILDTRRDIGACEVGAGVGIEETKLSKEDVLLFPNPTSQIATIRFKQRISKVSIFLYDLTGKIVLNVNSNNSLDVVIDTQPLRPGVYLVKIHAGNDYLTKRLVKQK